MNKKKKKHFQHDFRESRGANNEAIINHLCWFPEGSDMWWCSRQGKHTLAQVAVTNTLADLYRAWRDTVECATVSF